MESIKKLFVAFDLDNKPAEEVVIEAEIQTLAYAVNVTGEELKQIEVELDKIEVELDNDDLTAKQFKDLRKTYKEKQVELKSKEAELKSKEAELNNKQAELAEFKKTHPRKRLTAGDYCMYALLSCKEKPLNGSVLGKMAVCYTGADTCNGISMMARGVMACVDHLKSYDQLKAEIIAEYEAEKANTNTNN